MPPTRRGQRSRQLLLDAARTVFARRGFHEARIVDITAEAGIASGSFYTYFDSKEEIFESLLRDLEEELWSPGEARGSGDGEPADRVASPYEQILQANRAYLTAYRANAGVMVVWEQVATLNADIERLRRDASTRFVARIEAAVEQWQAAGTVPAGIDPRYAARALTGMVSNFAYRWSAQGDDFDLDRAADQLSRLWAGALGVPVPDGPAGPDLADEKDQTDEKEKS